MEYLTIELVYLLVAAVLERSDFLAPSLDGS